MGRDHDLHRRLSIETKDGFRAAADVILAERLQDIGCATVMPLGSPIGSGQGVRTREEIEIIIERAEVPVVVDAGLGVPSDASMVMEIGADAVLVNTAIAQAANPGLMGEAFRLGVEAGRKAHLAGRIPERAYATTSSPGAGRYTSLVAGSYPGSLRMVPSRRRTGVSVRPTNAGKGHSPRSWAALRIGSGV